jgi:hypothetical protein
MRETRITIPELALIAATRAAIGAGLGLLLGDRLAPDQRKAVGWTLLAVGVVSTFPLAFEVLGGGRRSAPAGWPEPALGGPRPEAEDRLLGPRTATARTGGI